MKSSERLALTVLGALMASAALSAPAKADISLYQQLKHSINSGITPSCAQVPGSEVIRTEGAMQDCVIPAKTIHTEKGVRVFSVATSSGEKPAYHASWVEVNCRHAEHRFSGGVFGLVKDPDPSMKGYHPQYRNDTTNALKHVYYLNVEWGDWTPMTWVGPLHEWGCTRWSKAKGAN